MDNCNCLTRGGRKSCINDFNCKNCGICLYWKGYEEGTILCGDCHNIKTNNPHPCAVIINEWFKDDVQFLAKFCYLGYFAFTPLIKYGTNGRKIHNDFDEYWAKYQKYFD